MNDRKKKNCPLHQSLLLPDVCQSLFYANWFTCMRFVSVAVQNEEREKAPSSRDGSLNFLQISNQAVVHKLTGRSKEIKELNQVMSRSTYYHSSAQSRFCANFSQSMRPTETKNGAEESIATWSPIAPPSTLLLAETYTASSQQLTSINVSSTPKWEAKAQAPAGSGP